MAREMEARCLVRGTKFPPQPKTNGACSSQHLLSRMKQGLRKGKRQ